MIKKISMGVARNGFDQSGHGALNLAVSQELIDGVNGFFAWSKFRTAKSDFNGFWIGLVKNGCGNLVHESLKSVEEVYALSCFLHADCDSIIFYQTNMTLFIFDF